MDGERGALLSLRDQAVDPVKLPLNGVLGAQRCQCLPVHLLEHGGRGARTVRLEHDLGVRNADRLAVRMRRCCGHRTNGQCPSRRRLGFLHSARGEVGAGKMETHIERDIGFLHPVGFRQGVQDLLQFADRSSWLADCSRQAPLHVANPGAQATVCIGDSGGYQRFSLAEQVFGFAKPAEPDLAVYQQIQRLRADDCGLGEVGRSASADLAARSVSSAASNLPFSASTWPSNLRLVASINGAKPKLR